jgi:hypothetical protein
MHFRLANERLILLQRHTELTDSIVCVTQLLCSIFVRKSFNFFDFRVSLGPGITQSVQRQGYGFNGPGRESRQGKDIFLFSKTFRHFLGPTQPLFSGYWGVKRTGREVDHSPPSGAKAKNEWCLSSTPPIRLHGVERGNFTCVQYFQTYIVNIIN